MQGQIQHKKINLMYKLYIIQV